MPTLTIPAIAAVGAEAGTAAAVGGGLAADVGIAGGLASTVLPEVAVTAAAPVLAGAGEAGIAAGTGLGAGIATDLATGITSDVAGAGAIGAGLSGISGTTSANLPGTALGLGGTTGAPAPAPTAMTPSAVQGAGAPGLAANAPPQLAGLDPTAVDPLAGVGGGAPASGSGAAAPTAPLGGSGGLPDTAAISNTTGGAGGTPSTSTISNTFGGESNVVTDAAKAVGDKPTGMFDKAMDFAEKNPLSIAGFGLQGLNMLMGNTVPPAQRQLQSLAGSNAAGAASLESYIQTGKLPAGLQSAVDSTTRANEAQIRSTFARMGLSGSTPEAQAIAGAKDQATGRIAKIAADLFAQGVSLANLSSAEWTSILNAQLAEDAAFNNSLAKFAGGLAGARTTGSSG